MTLFDDTHPADVMDEELLLCDPYVDPDDEYGRGRRRSVARAPPPVHIGGESDFFTPVESCPKGKRKR